MSSTTERSFNNLVSGKVFEDYRNLPYEGQKRVAIKTALVAAAAGLLAGIVIGSITGILFAGIVGLGAFTYFVTRYENQDEYLNDYVQGAIKRVTKQQDVVDEIIDGTVALYHKVAQKLTYFINSERA